MTSKPNRMNMVNHAAGIFADMSVDGPAIGTLVAIIDRAKNLPNRKTMGKQNPYCAARLGKEAKKTETDLRGGQTPRWDQELRFTVHESPDYFKLKVSVFNDDKRTDMIGETWVDLKDLIIPGGSQSDQWHPLQFRGKYAGDVRIEMTYYDTRPEDEAVIERRTGVSERSHNKSSGGGGGSSSNGGGSMPTASPAPVSSSSLSGPRQLKDVVKRRPLPSDPTGSAVGGARPPPPEKVPSAPAPLPQTQTPPAPRPVQEHAYSAPPGDYMRQPARHSVPLEAAYEHASVPHAPLSQAPITRSMRTYETPDDFHREWSQPAPVQHHPQPPAPAPAPMPSKRHPQEVQQYPSYRERPVDVYDPRASQGRPRSGYGNMPPADYRSSRQELPVIRPDQYQYLPEPTEVHVPAVAEPPRPSSHHSNYSFQTEQFPTVDAAMPQPLVRYAPRSSGSSMHHHPSLEYVQSPGPVEPDHHYRSHSNSLVSVNGHSPLRITNGRESFHAEYATMQPRVDDEEEEGPPPPPPVHRSGLVHSSQQLVPSPTPSYQAYSPEYAASPRASRDLSRPRSSHMMSDESLLQDLPPPTSGSYMPPSLVAGFDPVIAEAESDRAAHERHESRRRSQLFEESILEPPEPSPVVLPYPVAPPAISPPQMTDDRRSLVSRGSSSNSEMRLVPRRKSVSPQPPLPAEVSQIPFSPDSYDSFNPNAARSAVIRDPAPAYDTPSQAMDAARRSEMEAGREQVPIIGDDGKEIDPSDHLPTDTWAPEPERKNKKPVAVVRFKNAPTRTSPGPPAPAPLPLAKEYGPPRTKTIVTAGAGRYQRPRSSYGLEPVERTPPRDMDRGRQGYGGSYAHGRTYSTPNGTPSPRPRSHRSSVSPSPSIYEPSSPGPPIPSKVPIGGPVMSPNYPVALNSARGMDALSRELNSIDLGSVGCSNGRPLRKYSKLTTGYAS